MPRISVKLTRKINVTAVSQSLLNVMLNKLAIETETEYMQMC